MPDEKKESTELDKLIEGMKVQSEQMGQLTTMLAGQAQSHSNLEQTVTNLAQAIEKGVQPAPNKEEPLDFENMDSKALFSHILNAVTSASEKTAEQVTEQVNSLRSEIGRKDSSDALASVRSAKGNEDFDDWLPEMKALAETNKGLTVERLFLLAKAENPQKVADLVEKYKTEEQKALEKQEKDDADHPTFLSLTPTSTNEGISTDTDPDNRVGIKEGVEAALAEVVPAGTLSEYG